MAKYLVITVTSTTKVYVDKDAYAQEYGLAPEEVEEDARAAVHGQVDGLLMAGFNKGLTYHLATSRSLITDVRPG